MLAMVRIAALFRPLPPLGRGLAAATMMGSVVAVALAIRAAAQRA